MSHLCDVTKNVVIGLIPSTIVAFVRFLRL